MLEGRRRRGSGEPQLDQELAALDREAHAATDQARGHLLNRCGDACAAAGRDAQAVRYYGEAVDAYLVAAAVGPAAAMCRKILKVSPAAVRTHLTLACLYAHEGRPAEALREIDRFVDASRRTATETMAVPRLRLLGAGLTDAGLRQRVADHLAALGDAPGHDRIQAMLRGELPDESQRPGAWQRLLQAASADPGDLWKF